MGQKTEAVVLHFPGRKVAGDNAADSKTLAEVANSTAIDLIEVRLAREALVGAFAILQRAGARRAGDSLGRRH